MPAPSASFDVDAIVGCAKRASALAKNLTDLVPVKEASDNTSTSLFSEAHAAVRIALATSIEETAETEAALELTMTAKQMDEVEASSDAEQLATLEALEVQVWLDLDAFIRTLASRSGRGSGALAPASLLSLLPPKPPAGWPDEFLLEQSAIALREQAASARSMAMFNPSAADAVEPFVPCSHELYPARRRAQRLSFAVWALIAGGDNAAVQRALEATSTADRLRTAMLRLRELRSEAESS